MGKEGPRHTRECTQGPLIEATGTVCQLGGQAAALILVPGAFCVINYEIKHDPYIPLLCCTRDASSFGRRKVFIPNTTGAGTSQWDISWPHLRSNKPPIRKQRMSVREGTPPRTPRGNPRTP